MPLAAVGAAAAVVCGVAVALRRRRRSNDPPQWYEELFVAAERLRIAEWENGALWRRWNGWVGNDYAHGPNAGCRIAGYAQSGAGVGTTLVGAAFFGPNAESHKGLCHGGSMCAVMDDVIGWVGFCVSGTCVPWCGFTVQVNTSLQSPVAVGSWLRVEGTITAVERRKVRVKSTLVNPASGVVHCSAEGLFILNKTSVEASPAAQRPLSNKS